MLVVVVVVVAAVDLARCWRAWRRPRAADGGRPGPRRRLAVPAIALSAGWLTTAAFRALVV